MPGPELPRLADPLADVLRPLRIDGVFTCRSELTAPWGLDLPAVAHSLWFHVVTRGRCVLEDTLGERHGLEAGKLAVLPHGGGHRIVDQPESPSVNVLAVPHEYLGPTAAVLRHGGGGDRVDLVCGAVRLADPAARHLAERLPEVLVVDPTDGLPWLPALLDIVASESLHPGPGSEAVIARLCDVVVLGAIRSWIENDPGGRSGWLDALRDEHLGRALALVHRAPEADWTVAALASEAGLSRSAFSARFTDLVGEPPMTYVTRVRMEVATELLAEQQQTVRVVAETLGYESEASFSRAYKRVTGRSPGAVRRAGPLDVLAATG